MMCKYITTVYPVFTLTICWVSQIYNVMHKEDGDDLGESTGELASHQDLLYYENPPGIQVFNCLRLIGNYFYNNEYLVII